MYIKRLADCEEIIAGDRTHLRELLHPDRDPVSIRYSLAVARLAPGRSSTPHRLRTAEVYYIIKGTGEMHVGDDTADIHAGDAAYVPPGATQYIINRGEETVEFACIVDPAWRPEDEEAVG
jgi:mannose-6-phosphate isomerase-like protein (cupin superfamily)